MNATASIETPNAKRYLGQFCKHFAHKLPVRQAETNESGEVTFGAGACALAANETTLTLSVSGADEAQLATLKDVVERHLLRFAFREDVALSWR
jgi:hypothetical protein